MIYFCFESYFSEKEAIYLKAQLKVILLATLFLSSVPMVGNASSLTIHEVPIYSDSV